VDPRGSLDEMEKENSLPYRDSNSDPSVVQPVASRYTDCAIPALKRKGSLMLKWILKNEGVRINPVRTSQETYYVSATKHNRLMLFGEIIAVYC
jgi:hypothetical protein